MHYPKWKYHPEKSPEIIQSASEESALGEGWYNSPAEYGHESCPGLKADPVIAKRKKLMMQGK